MKTAEQPQGEDAKETRCRMNRGELHDFVGNSVGNEGNICQICAVRDGRTVYEDVWRGFGAGDAVHVMSVTKSVMALLVGIAIDRGCIQGVGQKVLDFFPGYPVKRGEKTIREVTIGHLLTMTAPFKYRSEPWTKVCTSPDWTLAALDLLGGRKGLTGEFRYATLGLQILSGVIENATRERCLDFANRHLFAPLGIPEVVPHGDSSKEDQFEYVMGKKPRKREWYVDPKGTVVAGWGLCLSARDLARIGELVLCGGVCGGRRIVSEGFVGEMTRARVQLGERFGFMRYGYLWYRPHEDREVFAGLGDGGNAIYASREENVAVGVTGTFKPRIFDRVEFIEKRVLPLCGG